MTDHDPKTMAKALRTALAADGIVKSHSACLEIVAQQWGYADWNTLSAALTPTEPKPLPRMILPNGWQISGTQAQDYRIGVDPDKPGSPARIVSTKDHHSPAAFATLMHSIEATDYVGKRVMCEADIRCFDTEGDVTIWTRVDDAHKKILAFDNMETRPSEGMIRGTRDWVTRRIVLEVPETADSIHFGFFLRGNGHAEARGFVLSKPPSEAVTTSFGAQRRAEPTNLDFVERSHRPA